MDFVKALLKTVALCAVVMMAIAINLTAAPPHPDLLEAVATAKKPAPYFLEHIQDAYKKGICLPEQFLKQQDLGNKDASSQAATTFRVLAVLVKFSDQNSSVVSTYFDSLVYGSNGPTVHNYFSEISYTQLDLVTVNLPSSLGWRTAPQSYAYYVNNQNGIGSYPTNTQKLTEDIVDQIDALVNFSQYDNDGNGTVDCLLLIHSGSGAEFTGNSSDIWSHKWAISPRSKDGVTISSFTVQPEYWVNPGDMTIGVYAHELGHGFGLPDLYDTDQSSNGIGKWCLMSYGSWNGTYPGGGSPAHPCAWSRIKMGMASAINVTSNLNGVSLENVEENGTIYRLWTSGNISNEYFLIENRQKIGYDFYIPHTGLLIWHIDENKNFNNQEWYPGQTNTNHMKVALEQSDGSFELEHDLDQGDAADPFPGTGNKTAFDATSSPNSDSYTNGSSFVGVQDIGSSGLVITADLVVGFSAGVDDDLLLPSAYGLSQNYPNPFNPSTTIGFALPTGSEIKLEIYNLKGELTTTLATGRYAAGNHSVLWDGRNKSGDDVASGIYFYRLLTEEQEISKKMVLIK